ncbi:MAG: hypothetical protein JO219_04530 [Candidatus Eremiobacteraeota bacterium]|nr:hypothetical protein [Candidatus Eremiobacteraeota bacterium]MBV8366769.1 hypothetical protein [Candidatus Eremiobacteraeota bacterium]
MRIRAVVFAGALAALCAVTSASQASARQANNSLNDAAEIFDRALAFVRAQNYPPYLTSVITVSTQIKGGRWLVEQFSSVCRTRDDRVSTASTPLSTTNHANNPYGFTLKVKGLAVPDTSNIDEPLGLPEISPIYDFGLAKLPPATSSSPAYDVSLLEKTVLHGRDVYVLNLTPLLDAKVYRLREMWVDAATFAVVRLISEGAFRSGPGTTVAWTINYTINHGHWLISDEATAASLLLGGYAPPVNSYVALPGATRYDGITYSFSNFESPKTVSDLVFLESRSSQAVQE